MALGGPAVAQGGGSLLGGGWVGVGGCLLAGGRGDAGRLEGGDHAAGVAPQPLGSLQVNSVRAGVGAKDGHLPGLGAGGEGGVAGHVDLGVEGGGGHQLPEGGVVEGSVGGEEEVVLPWQHVKDDHLPEGWSLGQGPLHGGHHVPGGLEHVALVQVLLGHAPQVGDVAGGGLEDQVPILSSGEEAGDHILKITFGVYTPRPVWSRVIGPAWVASPGGAAAGGSSTPPGHQAAAAQGSLHQPTVHSFHRGVTNHQGNFFFLLWARVFGIKMLVQFSQTIVLESALGTGPDLGLLLLRLGLGGGGSRRGLGEEGEEG